MPFYVLHQTFVLAAAFFVVRMEAVAWMKFGLIVVFAGVATLVCVRAGMALAPFRFLLGVKARRPGG